MIVYDRLWETMKMKGITQYRLIKYYKFSAGQINRLKQNTYVSTHTLDVLCTILECRIEDIMEFRPDSTQKLEFGIEADSKES
ncbi:MAG: helix-turn-helix transcriptional regulator [Eubacteriales bacterium]|nr:helix-turn-helix transcriptional regulator [Eubacteriales bacterium]